MPMTIIFFVFCYAISESPLYQESIAQAENIYTNIYFIIFRIIPVILIIFWIYAFRWYIIPQYKRKEAERIAEDKRLNKQWVRGLMKWKKMQKMVREKYTKVRCENCKTNLAIPNEKYKNKDSIICPNCDKITNI